MLIPRLDDDVEPLEIAVPAGFRLHMEGGGELPRSAHLVSPGLERDIVVQEPEAGFFSLSQERKILLRAAEAPTFIRAEETDDGFLLIDQNRLSGNDLRFDAVVSRPKLRVQCQSTGLELLSDAERVAAVCLTLQAAHGK